MLTHLDLFSGIGGFALATDWAGFETIGFVEIDKYCQKVLNKHWPDVPVVEDIRDVETIKTVAEVYQGNSSVTLITGGFPCQPFSVAGKRGGKGDNRYLWPEMFRVIREVRPRWVLGENVAGIVRMELDNVLSDLEGEGYTCQAFVIPACTVNAPHRRDRVWIVAYNEQSISRGGGFPRNARNKRRRTTKAEREGIQSQDREARSGNFEQGSQDVAFPQSRKPRQSPEPERGQDISRRSQEIIMANPFSLYERGDGIRWPSGAGWWEWEPAEALQYAGVREGQRDGLSEPKPQLGRVAHGIPHRVDRLKCLGNAIVPQVAYQIIRLIAQIEQANVAHEV